MNDKNATLQDVFNNRILVPKLNEKIDEGKTLEFLTEYVNSFGINVSLGTIRNYKKKREESISTGVPLEQLIDKRKKNGNIVELRDKENMPDEQVTKTTLIDDNYATPEKKLVNLTQYLELMIQKGYNSLQQVEFVDNNSALKAIDAYAKITGNATGGLTIQGLQELKLKQKAYEAALGEVIAEHIPKEEQEQVWVELEQKEQEFYDSLDLTEEGQRIKEALKQIGV